MYYDRIRDVAANDFEGFRFEPVQQADNPI
jgi:hypothetical protein